MIRATYCATLNAMPVQQDEDVDFECEVFHDDLSSEWVNENEVPWVDGDSVPWKFAP